MVLIAVLCPPCQSAQVIKGGTTTASKQRYRCQNAHCSRSSFVLNPASQAPLPEVKEQTINMALHGRGMRDTARVLKIRPPTVIHELKKRADVESGKPLPARSVASR